MLNIHVTGCNVCPFAVYEYNGGGHDNICNLIRWIDPLANDNVDDEKAYWQDALTTIPDKCPLDVTITKETHIS